MMVIRAFHLCRRLAVCVAVYGALSCTVAGAQSVEKIVDILEGIPTPNEVIGIAQKRAADRNRSAVGQSKAKPEHLPRFVLRSGDLLRGRLKETTVPVETPYGVLKLPVKDVVDIHFSLRIDNDVRKRVDAAIERLGADDFPTREAASSDLRNIGFDALPSLRLALKAGDEEVRKRAGEILERFGEVDEEALPLLSPRDRVRLSDVTVEGLVAWDQILVETEYGELKVDRLDLVRISVKEVGRKSQRLSIPASAVLPGWVLTKVRVEKGQKLKIAANGQVGVREWSEFCGPKGLGRSSKAYPGSRELSLVGRIGSKGRPFTVGANFKGTAPASGTLSLGIVPYRYSSSVTGSYDVKIDAR